MSTIPKYVTEWVDETIKQQQAPHKRFTREQVLGFVLFTSIADTYTNRLGTMDDLATPKDIQDWLDVPGNIYHLAVFLINER